MSTVPTDFIAVSQWLQAADRASAAGQVADAAQLLDRARMAAPAHPQVLDALGMHALKAGDFPAARRHLDHAVGADPNSALLWLHLAMACRAQTDMDGELTALERALALEPRYYLALLQKARLFERQRKQKEAAEFFAAFLHCVPPSTRQMPAMQQAIQHAENAVAANRAGLESFLHARLAATRLAHEGESQDRFDRCMDVFLGRRRVFTPQPTFMHFPHLPSIEYFERRDFPWLDAFEAATDVIRDEMLAVVDDAREIVPYVDYPDGAPLDQWRDLNRSRRCGAYYLLQNGAKIDRHLERCPRTAELLAAAPLADIPGQAPTAFFSLLAPRTHIPAHTGVTNTRLVVHVPLIVPQGCRFRVGSETRHWAPGQAWVFDDTIEHEAWNDSDSPRTILLIDIWNPFLTAAERDLVRTATTAIAEFKHE